MCLATFISMILLTLVRDQCSPVGPAKLRKVAGLAHRPTASRLDLNPNLPLSSMLFPPALPAPLLHPRIQREPRSGRGRLPGQEEIEEEATCFSSC